MQSTLGAVGHPRLGLPDRPPHLPYVRLNYSCLEGVEPCQSTPGRRGNRHWADLGAQVNKNWVAIRRPKHAANPPPPGGGGCTDQRENRGNGNTHCFKVQTASTIPDRPFQTILSGSGTEPGGGPPVRPSEGHHAGRGTEGSPRALGMPSGVHPSPGARGPGGGHWVRPGSSFSMAISFFCASSSSTDFWS